MTMLSLCSEHTVKAQKKPTGAKSEMTTPEAAAGLVWVWHSVTNSNKMGLGKNLKSIPSSA